MRRFSDITNTLHSRSANKDGTANAISVCSSAKDYVEQLQKENTELLKLVAERNKIIELCNHEVQKLRFTMQKASQQNWQLTQTNSQMLAELNSAKDTLKVQRHEHGCTTAMLKAKNSELVEKVNKLSHQISLKCPSTEKGPAECEITEQPKQYYPLNPNQRRHSEIPSLGNTLVTSQDGIKGMVDNKRTRSKRSSVTVECEESVVKDLFEIKDMKLSIPSLDGECKISSDLSRNHSANCSGIPIKSEIKDKEKRRSAKSENPQCQTEESRRSNAGRPMRRAAEKVSSYKEIPVNIKMRRIS